MSPSVRYVYQYTLYAGRFTEFPGAGRAAGPGRLPNLYRWTAARFLGKTYNNARLTYQDQNKT